MKIESISDTQSSVSAYKDVELTTKDTTEKIRETDKKEISKRVREIINGEDSEDKKSGEASSDQIRNAVNRANEKIVKMENTSLEFSYHEPTHRIAISVIDDDTKKVIREIPPEESLEMLQKIWELAGIIVDERG